MSEGCNLYESDLARDVFGETLRPGGFFLTHRAMSYCSLKANDLVVDVGCGRGASASYLTQDGLRVIGVDKSTSFVREAVEKYGNNFICASAENLPIEDKIADAILCECVFSLVDNKTRAMNEFYRVLKDSGFLIISDMYIRRPEFISEARNLPFNSCVTGALAEDELKGMILDSGFDLELWEDHTKVLKEFIAKMIFRYGTAKDFWNNMLSLNCSCNVQETISLSKPGYFLLIARKKG